MHAGARLIAPIRRIALGAGLAAAEWRRRTLRRVAFIAVTGSCGKTTTKELAAGILARRLRGTKSPGGSNSLKVVGKTVLSATRRDGFCVIEVAAWEPGSVARAARVIRPYVAVVTNVGADHRKAFRTLEATAGEKRTLLDHVVEGGTAVLNADDPRVAAMAEGFGGRLITFGRSPEATLRAEDVQSAWPERLSFTLRTDGGSLPVRTRLCGEHWMWSALAALGVARAMGIPVEEAVESLAELDPHPGRMSPVVHDGVTFVRDDAKAPLWTIATSLEFLAQAQASRKVAVIGTISDYAQSASKTYRWVAHQALAVADEVIFAGPNARHALKARTDSRAGALHAYPTLSEATQHLRGSLREGDLVLVKGSKGDKLERIIGESVADRRTRVVPAVRRRRGHVR